LVSVYSTQAVAAILKNFWRCEGVSFFSKKLRLGKHQTEPSQSKDDEASLDIVAIIAAEVKADHYVACMELATAVGFLMAPCTMFFMVNRAW
jgi:hypothetical protein